MVTARSQTFTTGVATVVLLLGALGSLLVVVTEEFAVIVPAATVDGTFTTTMMSADVPAAIVGLVQFTVPVPPTAGAVQVQPAGANTDSKVVFGGVASVKLSPVADAGPLFVTVWV